jgi:FkbM family methyltransferase
LKKVSIIIPAYNSDKYIEQTVASVLKQTYQNFEVIIVNDGSTDNTQTILEEILKSDNRIKLINKENSGVSDSRNIGIDASTGDFIAFLDADDVWLEKNLELKIKALNDDFDFVYSDYYNTDENLNVIGLVNVKESTKIHEEILQWKENIIPSSLIIKRKCIDESHIRFSSELSNIADQHFAVLLSLKYSGYHIKKPLLKYRIHPFSMSKSIQLLEKDAVKAYKLYSKDNVWKTYLFKRQSYGNMYFMLGGSWWKNGKNRLRGIKFIFLSVVNYPPIIFKLIKKIFIKFLKQPSKFLYEFIPFKKQIFSVLKPIQLPESIYKHLHFKGIFSIKLPNAKKFKMHSSGYVQENELFWGGIENGWEKTSISIWQKLCKDSKVILDIGANSGIYSLVSKAINPNASVYAFEPLPKVLEALHENIYINNYDIKVEPCAVSNYNGDAVVYMAVDMDYAYSVTVNKSLLSKGTPQKEVPVKTKTLKTFIEENNLSFIDLIKIDVETHEPEVLEGMGEYLNTFNSDFIIEIWDKECAEKINAIFKNTNYLFFDIDDKNGKITHKTEIVPSSFWNYLICKQETAKKLNLVCTVPQNEIVSIIIPAYNAEKYIEETINSVFQQTYQYFEIIVVNDGSTDNTRNIVEDLTEKDSRITLINKSNTGVSDTRNVGISEAIGSYIAFLDADDYWLENNLELKVNTLKNGYDFVFSDMLNSDENLTTLGLAPVGKDLNILEDILSWNGECIPGPCSNLVISRKCLEQQNVRFHPELSNLADQHFCVLLAKYFKGYRIDKPLWKYRILPYSMSKSLMILEKDALKVLELYSNAKLFKTFLFKRKCYSNTHLMLAGSWWKNGNNKMMGLKFIVLALIYYPPAIIILSKKLIQKLKWG